MTSHPMAQDIIRCDLCSKGIFTGITPAEVVCKTCTVYLCKLCMTEHISSQLSVKHDILGIRFHNGDFNFIMPTCHIHKKLKCDLNCQECHIPVCSKCIGGVHKKHDVREISKIFNSKKEIMQQDTEELEKLILPTYEEIDAEYEDSIAKVPGGYDNFKKAITKQGEELHTIVDIFIKKHLKKAERMEKEDVATLLKDQSEIRKQQRLARDIFQANKTHLQSNDTNKVINYKSKNNEFKKVIPKTEVSSPIFSPKEISSEVLIQMFGEIKPSMKTEVPTYNIQYNSEMIPFKVKKFLDQPKSTEISLGLDDPYNVCCVPYKDQLYVREKGSHTVHHFDNNGKLLKQIKINSSNTDIYLSVTRDGRLIYSDTDDRSVNVVCRKKMETVIRLQEWKPRAICSTSNNGLLVTMRSDNGKSKVVRYAGSTVKQEIELDDQGKALYSYPSFIAENRNLDICVINWIPDILVIVDKEGKLKCKYNGEYKLRKNRAFNPYGLATDSQCHILVTDYNNDCVHILNQNGAFIRYIANCNLHWPTDLTISSEDVLYAVDDTKNVKVIQYLQ